MMLLTMSTDYTETINIANYLQGTIENSVIFHCYWNGILNEKHLYSILSCYYFNKKHKIVLWLENNTPNEYNCQIEKYAEIKYFSLTDEKKNAGVDNFYYNKTLSFYSDVVRYLLLYNYGGIWFDLDCFFLRNFDPLFYNFKNEICVYQWENQYYPNGAIFISLQPKCEKMKKIIDFIINRGWGWGFQEASLTYDLPLDILVLPCSWFDADFLSNPFFIGTVNFLKNTDKQYTFDNFHKGSFCYHWHNEWNVPIEENSPILQLVKVIQNHLQ